MKIPYAKVDCSGRELELVSEVLASGWLTTAKKAKALENNISQYLDRKHGLAVNSCTSALHLALDAVGVGPGDKVFVPSLTFTASAEVIRYLDAHPVVLDVDYQTSNISPEQLEKAISEHPDVKAMVAVHFGGLALQMETTNGSGILDICKKHGIPLIEDAAHAFPSRTNGKLIGSFGDITCLSFYANKTMTTGEGGMLLTDNDDYAKRVNLMRLHGINKDVWDRFTSGENSWEYDVVAPGYKYNMPDLSAAVGLAQFERLESMHLSRVAIAERYFEGLSESNVFTLPYRPDNLKDHAWHLYPIKVNEPCGFSRNEVIKRFTELGIGVSVHYKPLHRLSYYRDTYGLSEKDFPNSEAIWQQTISLPIYNLLTSAEADFIVESLLDFNEAYA